MSDTPVKPWPILAASASVNENNLHSCKSVVQLFVQETHTQESTMIQSFDPILRTQPSHCGTFFLAKFHGLQSNAPVSAKLALGKGESRQEASRALLKQVGDDWVKIGCWVVDNSCQAYGI